MPSRTQGLGTGRPARDTRTRVRLLLIGLGLVALCAYGLLGIATGVTVDNDSQALLETFRSLLDGEYRVSRTSGFPLYEFSGASAYAVGGVRGAMVLSLVFTLSALVILIEPTRALRSWSGLVAWLGVALTPIIFTNASAIMETALLLLMISLLCLVLSTRHLSNRHRPVVLAVVMIAMVLTRPDSIFLGAATSIALLTLHFPLRVKKTVPWEALSAAIGILIGFLALWAITRRNPFMSEFLPTESPIRRVLRGIVGTATLFGPVGAIALLVLLCSLVVLVWKLRTESDVDNRDSPLHIPRFASWWALSTLLLYGLRFLTLPDELEYLLPVLVVLAVTSACITSVSTFTGTLSLVALGSAVATGLVSVSLLDRTSPWQVTPGIGVSLQPGGWVQDLQSRRAAQIRSTQQYQDFLRKSLGPLQVELDSRAATLLPRDAWNYVLNPGYAQYFYEFESIIGCDEITSETLIPAWRVSQRAASFADITAFDRNEPVACEVVASMVGPIVTPVNSGRAFAGDDQFQRPQP